MQRVEALYCSVYGLVSSYLWASPLLLSIYFLLSPFPTPALFSVNNHSNMFDIPFTCILINCVLIYMHVF